MRRCHVGTSDDYLVEHPKASGVDCSVGASVGRGEVEYVSEYGSCPKCREEFMNLNELKAHRRKCRRLNHGSSSSGVRTEVIDQRGHGKALAFQDPIRFDPCLCCARCKRTFSSKENLVRHIEKYDFNCAARNVRKRGQDGSEAVREEARCAEATADAMEFALSNQHSLSLMEVSCNQENYLSEARGMDLRYEDCPRRHVCHESANECSSGSLPSVKLREENQTISVSMGKSSAFKEKSSNVRLVNLAGEDGFPLVESVQGGTHKRALCRDRVGETLFEKEVHSNVPLGDLNELNVFSGHRGLESPMEEGLPSEGGTNVNEYPFRKSRSAVGSVLFEGNENPHQENRLFACDYCGKSYGLKPELRNHIVNCHLTPDPQKCTVCHRSFTNEEELREHSKTHPKGKMFYCAVCEECFCFKTELRMHIMEVHDSKTALICSIYSNRFLSKVDIGLQKALVRTESKKSFKCNACGELSIGKTLYGHHIRFCDLKEVCFQCNVCGKEFCAKDNLSADNVVRTKEKKSACRVCH
ncbi:uncharacterized protein [Hetaerina americana]|uniref:uncharacterized protein n=1 Tax=Hetaerina americana TaxID=62018 RepID=UPI003A7F56CE